VRRIPRSGASYDCRVGSESVKRSLRMMDPMCLASSAREISFYSSTNFSLPTVDLKYQSRHFPLIR
jgi:hypothetical protein